MDDNNLEDEVSKFLQGFKLMYKQIKDLLTKFEVKEMDCLGKEFDPRFHHAVSTVKTEEKSGIIIEVPQKGYLMNEKVIRPAMVIVSQ